MEPQDFINTGWTANQDGFEKEISEETTLYYNSVKYEFFNGHLIKNPRPIDFELGEGSRELKDNEVSYQNEVDYKPKQRYVFNADGTKRPIDFESGGNEQQGLSRLNGIANTPEKDRHYNKGGMLNANTDTRQKSYVVKYAKDGVCVEGYIDGELVQTGIVKFNRKDKLDVN